MAATPILPTPNPPNFVAAGGPVAAGVAAAGVSGFATPNPPLGAAADIQVEMSGGGHSSYDFRHYHYQQAYLVLGELLHQQLQLQEHHQI